MDAIIQKLLEEGGKTLLASGIKACIEKLARRKKKRLTQDDKRGIEATTEKMIQAATLEDVHRYSPVVIRLDRLAHYAGGMAKRAPSKRSAAKKVGRRAVVTKKAPAKRRAVKKR